MSKFIQINLPFIPAEDSMISNPDPIKVESNKKDGHFCKRCKDFFNLFRIKKIKLLFATGVHIKLLY